MVEGNNRTKRRIKKKHEQNIFSSRATDDDGQSRSYNPPCDICDMNMESLAEAAALGDDVGTQSCWLRAGVSSLAV